MAPKTNVWSGSMTTVLSARELGGSVKSVSGPVTSAASIEPNELIKQPFASLVTHPSDVIALLDIEATTKRKAARPELG